MGLLAEATETHGNNAEVVDTIHSGLTKFDVGALIDIASKLQYANDNTLAMRLLGELDELLGISGSIIGVYNQISGKNEYMVATLDKELAHEFSRNSYLKISGYTVFSQEQIGNLRGFFCIKHNVNVLDLRQREIIKIILPYLYSSVTRLHLLFTQLLVFSFTDRESEVIQWIITGKDNWSISKILGVSERTVKFHNCNIYKKLGVNTKAEAISLYHKLISHG